jgi:cob(I)alamin adenosyltransferase
MAINNAKSPGKILINILSGDFFISSIGFFMEQGLIQIYTGDGKGKTTAAIGQAIRAAGNGLKVVFVQFLKADDSGEVGVLSKMGPLIQIYRFNSQKKFIWNMEQDEIDILKADTLKGYDFIRKIIEDASCDILVLDEFNWVLNNNFVDTHEFVGLMRNKPGALEIIITGRNVPAELCEAADLVTEMKKIKHPIDRGIQARKGIER